MKTLRKVVKFIVVIVVVVVVLDVLFIYTVAHWRPEIEHADAVIVLGAAINTPALYNRTLEGLQLYEQGKAEVMVLSGGKISASDISEAQYMEKVIKKNTMKLPAYVLEEESHSTYDNIKNSQAKLKGKESVIVVSDQFHLARAVLLAKRAGFEDVYWSAPWPTYYSGRELRYYYIREIIALINYIPKLISG